MTRFAKLGLILLSLLLLPAQEPVEWVCPMDPEIRAKAPGRCSKCGMDLEPGIPDPVEYPVKLKVKPPGFRAGRPVELQLEVLDPEKRGRVRKFRVIHEKLFHLFLVSQDLEYFVHEHPALGEDGILRLKTTLPKPGPYRLMCDFYPEGGTPQMIPKSLIVAGEGMAAAKNHRAQLEANLRPQQGVNLEVELETEPPQPIAGKKTLLFFRLKPAEGLEPYLGVWGHMLAASDDLIDLLHEHPAIADGGPQVQFNIIFPREAMYRIWVQFQRQGKVNTVSFTVPVSSLK